MAAKKQRGNQKKAKKAQKTKKAEDPEGAAAAQNAQKNPKAFTFRSTGKAKAAAARSAEKEQRRLHGGSSFGAQSCLLQCFLCS